jgi:hypothetical protein
MNVKVTSAKIQRPYLVQVLTNEHGLGEDTERGTCQYVKELRTPTEYICIKLVNNDYVKILICLTYLCCV